MRDIIADQKEWVYNLAAPVNCAFLSLQQHLHRKLLYFHLPNLSYQKVVLYLGERTILDLADISLPTL